MIERINRVTFDRMLAERALSVTAFSELSGVSKQTLAKIRRGDAVAIGTIDKIAGAFENIAVRPHIAELIAS